MPALGSGAPRLSADSSLGGGDIVVASTIDNRLLAQAGVIATSLAAHAPQGRRIRYIILLDGEMDAVAERLAGFDHGGVRVEIRPVANPLAHFPLITTLPPATLLRLMLPDLLPEFSRVLYIDGDVLVRDDVSGLFDLDLGAAMIGMATDIPIRNLKRWGVFDVGRFRGTFSDYCAEILGLDPMSGPLNYVNSGVMLMQLDRLRAFGLADHARDHLERFSTELIYADQCVLNAVLPDHIHRLDLRWNLMATGFGYAYRRRADAASRALFDAAARKPGIIHFTGPRKPWLLPRDESILAPKFAGQWWFYARHAPEARALREGYVAARWWLPRAAPTPLPDLSFRSEAMALRRRLETIGLGRKI
ncbi:Lipopolysaccharide biosynthesis protein, LPS:glycosyltransferase [Devosia enhydra]|uniref:Lipopolysaccharide biosynthesis protein, LPS:glycosyltransferase n=1 Tax=Devosia enhydra TaxID=665118 RepID=A0A1K2HU26_9HYPH|nr:glycosyltransferase family 8 protein [Devosia enhydra]SFZ80932.1 Lipopolysaccharide biosynthesis protein, LPS:glycosyltransferase [Devosia enhydra]